MCWKRTRKPSIAGSGRTRFVTRTHPSPKPSRRSPITKKPVGDPVGLTELMVFYCGQAAGYCQDIGYQEEGFFGALVRMFEQALKSANTLPANDRDSLIARLNRVRKISHAFGYGVGDDVDYLLAKYVKHSG